MTNNPTPQRMLEIYIHHGISAKYHGTLPVRLSYGFSEVLLGVTVKVSITGQSRSVFVPDRVIQQIPYNRDVVDQVIEEVFFAVFLLLDEDEDA